MKFQAKEVVNGVFDSFTVVEVTVDDIGTVSPRMKQFLAKFQSLPGVDETDETTLVSQVVSRFAHPG